MRPYSLDQKGRRVDSSEGFTLIELLIVIVILGILATIVVFAVGGITEKGEAGTCATDRRTLATAVEAYFGKAGHYPATEAEMTTGDYKFLRQVSTNYDLSAVTSAGGLVAQGVDC